MKRQSEKGMDAWCIDRFGDEVMLTFTRGCADFHDSTALMRFQVGTWGNRYDSYERLNHGLTHCSFLYSKAADGTDHVMHERSNVYPSQLKQSFSYDQSSEQTSHEERNEALDSQGIFLCVVSHRWEKG